MGGDESVLCESFLLGRLVSVLVNGAGSCLSGGQCRSQWFVFWGVCGFGMALGSLSFNVQVCVPVLLEN